MVDVAKGVEHCHANGIIIVDLKPSNVILVHDGNRLVGKVSDLGLAMGEGGESKRVLGTPSARKKYRRRQSARGPEKRPELRTRLAHFENTYQHLPGGGRSGYFGWG